MDNERLLIKEALPAEKVTTILNAWYILPTKESKESIDARKEGNKLFAVKPHDAQIHENIWKYYSQSIAKAPIGSEDLACAYSNRSALLLHIGKCEDSVKDIDRALQITQSNCLKVKLLCRKLHCFSVLGMDELKTISDQAMHWLDRVEHKEQELLRKNLKKTLNRMKSDIKSSLLEKEFPKMSIENNLSSEVHSEEVLQVRSILKNKESADPFEKVSLKFNHKYGRHLIAKKDIHPGEIVNVTKPYATALNLNNFYAFCGHCLKTSWASIPCDYCSWCMFCSEKCKTEAWEKYHDIECKVIPYIQFNLTSDYWKQLSLKMTIMAVREAGSIEKLKEELKKIDNCKDNLKKGFVNNKFQENCFQSAYSLSSNVSSSALQIHVDHAVLTLIILAKSTNFFGQGIQFRSSMDLLSNEDIVFIGSLLLKFLKISDINAHSVMEGSSGCRFSNSIAQCQKNRCCERGACIATVSSFLNHSCYPTARKCFTEDMQLIVYALQPIKKNHQLFDSYIGYYFDQPYSRRNILTKEFNFKCNCLPCKKQWPAIFSPHNHMSSIHDDNQTKASIERALLTKYQDLIECRDGKIFNLKALKELSEDIEKAKNELSEPSLAISTLISTLWSIFDHIYGMKLQVNNECSNI